MKIFRNDADGRFGGLLDASAKLDLVCESLQEVEKMICEVNGDLCRDGFKPSW